MNSKISKTQLEVWQWKENLYDKIKDIPENDRIDYLQKKVVKTVERLKKAIRLKTKK